MLHLGLRDKYFFLTISLIVLMGAFFRFYNLNWDQGFYFHPDERNIATAVSKISFFDNLNPHFFAYGGFSIYFYRIIGEVLKFLTGDAGWVFEWGKINLIGRIISASVSTFSIILFFLIGKKTFGKSGGLISAAIATTTVSFVQTAHYGVTESLLIFWLLISILLSIDYSKNSKLNTFVYLAIISGLAIATKTTAVSFLIIPATSWLVAPKRKLSHLPIFVLIGFGIFLISSAYTFLDWPKFKESMIYESSIALGKFKVVYVLQFEKTLPYLFQLKNFFWQIGPTIILAIPSLLVLLYWMIKKRDKQLLVLSIFGIVYFLYVGSWHTKFMRFMVPVLPIIIFSTAHFLTLVRNRWRRIGDILILTVILINTGWLLAFFSIYQKEQTRITASKWIYQNIPSNSKIYTEHWDDGLPLNLKDKKSQFLREELTIYEPDGPKKVDYFAEKLSKGEYIIISSRRLFGTLIRLDEKYPVTSKYYKFLFSNRLGYEKVAQFSSYPNLFGLEINDDASEETFQVYDHPTIYIFHNLEKKSKDFYLDLLDN